MISVEAKEHLANTYPHHLKIYTDGSVLESYTGAGFVIPDLKVKKSYCLGKNFSVFTAELYAILMALSWISDLNVAIYSILICVDSKSVLCSLRSWDANVRKDLIFDIKFMIHSVMAKGTFVEFCWIPSHCGIYGNEIADKLAKEGALRKNPDSRLKLDKHEINSLLENYMNNEKLPAKTKVLLCQRSLSSIIYKMRLNSWKTKFSMDVECACGLPLSIQHILFECPILTSLYNILKLDIANFRALREILYSPKMIDIAKAISSSVIFHLL